MYNFLHIGFPNWPIVRYGNFFTPGLKKKSYLTGASLPPRQPRQLPWLFFETIMNSAWQIWKKKNIFIILPSIKNSLNMLGLLCRFEEIFIPPRKKNSLNILGLLCRIEEINTFIILPSIKNTPWISWVFFADLKK